MTHAHMTHAHMHEHTHPHTHTLEVPVHLLTSITATSVLLLFCPSLNWGAHSSVVQYISFWMAVLEWSGEGVGWEVSQWRWVGQEGEGQW